MNFFQESVYIDEIIFQANMAEDAAKRLRENVDSYNKYEIWGTIQLILIASANLKYFGLRERIKLVEKN